MRSDRHLLAEGYPAIWTDPEKRAVPVPPNVYYNDGNFYFGGHGENHGKGMGDAFYAKWRARASEFPTR